MNNISYPVEHKARIRRRHGFVTFWIIFWMVIFIVSSIVSVIALISYVDKSGEFNNQKIGL